MDEHERQRLQQLLDAIHLTEVALRERAARRFAGAMPTAMGPMPVPRGWPAIRLGVPTMEAAMFPYLTGVPQMYPMLPTYPVGLSHAAYQPSPYYNPLQTLAHRTGYMPGAYYNQPSYIPGPYAPGLLHAGYEGAGYGGPIPQQPWGIGGPIGYNPLWNQSPIGHLGQLPLQPNWSLQQQL